MSFVLILQKELEKIFQHSRKLKISLCFQLFCHWLKLNLTLNHVFHKQTELLHRSTKASCSSQAKKNFFHTKNYKSLKLSVSKMQFRFFHLNQDARIKSETFLSEIQFWSVWKTFSVVFTLASNLSFIILFELSPKNFLSSPKKKTTQIDSIFYFASQIHFYYLLLSFFLLLLKRWNFSVLYVSHTNSDCLWQAKSSFHSYNFQFISSTWCELSFLAYTSIFHPYVLIVCCWCCPRLNFVFFFSVLFQFLLFF